MSRACLLDIRRRDAVHGDTSTGVTTGTRNPFATGRGVHPVAARARVGKP
jgi:hypothetical protein